MKNKLTAVLICSALLAIQNINSQNKNTKNEFQSNIIQMGIVAYDLGKTLDFYKNVIGMKEVRTFAVDNTFSKKSGLSDGTPFKVTVLRLNDNKESAIIKIMSFPKKPNTKNNKFIQDALGIRYITIHLNSMKPIFERIKKHKIKFLGQTPLAMGGGNIFALIKDPNGVFIELIGKK